MSFGEESKEVLPSSPQEDEVKCRRGGKHQRALYLTFLVCLKKGVVLFILDHTFSQLPIPPSLKLSLYSELFLCSSVTSISHNALLCKELLGRTRS